MMRVVVTGGAGFVGSHVVERLIHFGHTPIVIDNLSSGVNYAPAGVEVYVHSLQDISSSLATLMALKSAQAIIHCAAYADLRSNWGLNGFENRDRLLDDNIHGTVALLENMPMVPIAMTSTASVYGANDGAKVSEEHATPESIESPYAASKLAAEAYIAAYAHACGHPWYCARLVNVVGSRTTHGVIGDFVRKAKSGTIHAEDDGTQRKNWVHVDDVADALIRMVTTRDVPSGIYTVSSNDTISWWNIIDEMDWPRDKVTFEKRDRGAVGDPHNLSVSNMKLSQYYRCDRSVRDGIQEALKAIVWERPQ